MGVLQALVGWPQQLTDPNINDADCTIGRLGDPIYLPQDHRHNVNSHFRRENPDMDVPFARVRGSGPGVYKATQRYFTPDIETKDLPEFVDVRGAMKVMKDVFRPYVGNCDPCNLHETYFNGKSAIGWVLKNFSKEAAKEGLLKRPWRFKYEVFLACPNLTLWMHKFAHFFDIPVLWETAGKAEILKIKKVNSGDIRTFTFADPFYTLNYCNFISGVKTLMIFLANIYHASPIRMGVTFIKGSFDTLMQELVNMWVVKGDCVKWDASFRSSLNDVVYRIFCYVLQIVPGSTDDVKLKYFLYHAFYSFVRMPLGEIYQLLYKKSGDPWTTGGNCMAHLFILLCHLVWMAREMKIDPYVLFLKMMWNIYADDHLNGYPRMCGPYISFEHRARFYRAFGVNLHPPPDDVVQDGPLGGVFLGATVVEKHGRFVPSYTKERLIAILWCKEYGVEELEEVLVSIAPLINSNSEAYEIYKDYIQKHFPRLVPLLDMNDTLFSGNETRRSVGGIKSVIIHNVK